MIRKITTYVFVGSDADLLTLKSQPAILHAAKEPWHRKFVGYVTRGAPKESPEYLYAVRFMYSEMALNLVDVDDPGYVNRDLVDAAVNFVNFHRCKHRNVFIHCNQGLSRAPTIGMLAIAPQLAPVYEDALVQFMELYPDYNPKRGVQEFARRNWESYHADSTSQGSIEGPGAEPGVSGLTCEGRTLLGQCSESVSALNGDSLDTFSSGDSDDSGRSEYLYKDLGN